MRIFNKIIESNKEPSNYNDIWFDGISFKIYKEGEWQAITFYNGGGVDPELLEGYMPLNRDFSDDFNNDFTR